MIKLDCKRGYKLYSDFNHNRLIFIVKNWYKGSLILDVFYNEQFLGYVITDATWQSIFSSDNSDYLFAKIIKENTKLKDYEDVFNSMKLVEENLMFEYNNFQLYVTTPYHQNACLKVCKVSNSNEKRVLHQCQLNAYLYQEIYDSCVEYLEGLNIITNNLLRCCSYPNISVL